MQHISATLPKTKTIACIAHDNKKQELIEWCKTNLERLKQHKIVATGTTGKRIQTATGLEVTSMHSGPLGGDQQIGSQIAEGKVDVLIFFWDPFEPMPHDPDVKALLRIAAVWNIPVACNAVSADFIISSSLLDKTVERSVPDLERYMAGRVD